MSTPEGDDAKGAAESKASPALFQASAAGGGPAGRGPSSALKAGALGLLAVVAVVVLRLFLGRAAPAPESADAGPPKYVAPTPVAVPEGAMVSVPGGTYELGSTDGDPDEKPVVTVTVGAFTLDTTEVTVAAFARCVSAGKCTEPDTGMYCNWHKEGHDDHPVNCVDQKQATDFCAFAGKRLPTEEEWEFAARGPDGRRYPWKDGAPGAQLCWNGEGSDMGKGQRQGTCPVASYPAGRSQFGAFDMAGNVWEWTSSGHCPYDHRGCTAPTQIIRGGAWNNVVPQYVRSQDRAEEAAGSRHDNVGFRCVKNP
jgi:sulfatase modifying factor 1